MVFNDCSTSGSTRVSAAARAGSRRCREVLGLLEGERLRLWVHNPISNLRLRSGVMPLRKALDRGIQVALGSDEAITDDAVSMWAVAKTAGLVHNITSPDWTT